MYIYIRYTVACQYREKRRIKKRTRESRRGHERRTSKRDNDRGDRYGRKSSRSSGETLIEDRVPSRNLRACIRSAENPMLNLTSRTFQVAVKRIRYAQSWPIEYIGKSLKFFYRWKMLELKKRNASLIIILDSICSTRYWILGEANDFVNLAKIVRHFLYIFYRDLGRKAAKRIVFIVETVTSGGKWLILWRLLLRDNSINSSRVLEASSSWLD